MRCCLQWRRILPTALSVPDGLFVFVERVFTFLAAGCCLHTGRMKSRYCAPATSYAFERPPWARWALMAAGALVLGVLLAWALQPAATFWQRAVAISLVLAASWILLGVWRRWAVGMLLWNGECWVIQTLAPAQTAGTDGESVELETGLDGGGWLWLKAVKKPVSKGWRGRRERVVWLYLSERCSPAQWGDLRRAVYSPAISRVQQG